jgi:hypothetical protein
VENNREFRKSTYRRTLLGTYHEVAVLSTVFILRKAAGPPLTAFGDRFANLPPLPYG